MRFSLRPMGFAPATEALFIAALLPMAGGLEAQEVPRPLRVLAENLTAQEERPRAGEGGGSTMLPGDVVGFTLFFTNTTNDSIQSVEFLDAIPPGLVLELGTPGADRPDVVIDYSLDGGETWSLDPVVQFESDGQVVTRPAPAEAYTHIRWRVEGWIQPGGEAVARFRARLPARKTWENGGRS